MRNVGTETAVGKEFEVRKECLVPKAKLAGIKGMQ